MEACLGHFDALAMDKCIPKYMYAAGACTYIIYIYMYIYTHDIHIYINEKVDVHKCRWA